uniref:Uncharacterized protein n=1 Tax=Cryptomonas curvata TaxID=233186 RepID=A0A7S0QLT5_9CRYP
MAPTDPMLNSRASSVFPAHIAESNSEFIFAQPSEARLPDSSSDSESVSSTDNGLFESNGNRRDLYMISGENFGSSDITQFSDDLIRLGERLDCLSCGNAGADGAFLDSIEEDIALISDEIEAILLLPRSQPNMEISNIQVHTKIMEIRTRISAMVERVEELECRCDDNLETDS